MKYQVTKTDELVIVINQPYNDYQRYLFANLYRPILSYNATLLYDYLNTQVSLGKTNSDIIEHHKIIKSVVPSTAKNFKEALCCLEGVGLVRTFVKSYPSKDPFYVYLLPRLLEPKSFFSNLLLSTMLEAALGHDHFLEIMTQFLVNKYDLSTFEEITSPLDVAFYQPNNADYNSWTIDTSGIQPMIKNQYLNYELYLTLLLSHDIIDKKFVEDHKLCEQINKLAWLYGLNETELKDATLFAIKDQTIDYEDLKRQVRLIYDHHHQAPLPPFVSKPQTESSDQSKVVKLLNTLSPLAIIQGKYGTKILGSEIAMFERILDETKVAPGVLNVLIIYVLENRNGNIPTINYFKKILNQWIREKITTTEQALTYIETATTRRVNASKTAKTFDWQEKYEQEHIKNNEQVHQEVSLEELEKMFKGKKQS